MQRLRQRFDERNGMDRECYRVLWARAATHDLVDLVAYLAADSPTDARKVARRLKTKASTLDVSPHRGRLVPELSGFGVRTFRELLVRPYRLLYRVSEDRVFVLALFDGRREIDEVLFERLVKDRT